MADEDAAEASMRRLEVMRLRQALGAKDIEIEEIKLSIANQQKAKSNGIVISPTPSETEEFTVKACQSHSTPAFFNQNNKSISLEIQAMKAQIQKLTTDNQALESEIEVLKAENGALIIEREALQAEEESLKTSYLSAVWTESPYVQQFIEHRVEAISQTQIDQKASKIVDEYFEPENRWIWKTLPGIIEYIGEEVKSALSRYFELVNETTWKSNSKIVAHVNEQTEVALETYFDPGKEQVWQSHPRVAAYVEARVHSEMRDYFKPGNEYAWSTNVTIMEYVDAKVEAALGKWFTPGNEHVWKAHPNVIEHVNSRLRSALSNQFNPENASNWTTNPTVVDYVDGKIAAALSNYFHPENDPTWKSNSRVANHVGAEVKAALRGYFNTVPASDWQTERKVVEYVTRQNKAALDAYFSPENTRVSGWAKLPHVLEHVDNQVQRAINDYFHTRNANIWKLRPEIVQHVDREIMESKEMIIVPVQDTSSEASLAFCKIGRAVRQGFLDRNLPDGREGDELILKLRDQAIRYGSPVVDASLYYTSATPRTDSQTFLNLYGVDWQTVRKLQECQPFKRLIKMRGTVKSWKFRNFNRTDFCKSMPRGFAKLFGQMSLVQAEAYFSANKEWVAQLNGVYGRAVQEYLREQEEDDDDDDGEYEAGEYVDGVQCWQCQGWGHFKRDCPFNVC